MKRKLLPVLAASIFCLSVAGCGQATNAPTSGEELTSEAPTTEAASSEEASAEEASEDAAPAGPPAPVDTGVKKADGSPVMR